MAAGEKRRRKARGKFCLNGKKKSGNARDRGEELFTPMCGGGGGDIMDMYIVSTNRQRKVWEYR